MTEQQQQTETEHGQDFDAMDPAARPRCRCGRDFPTVRGLSAHYAAVGFGAYGSRRSA